MGSSDEIRGTPRTRHGSPVIVKDDRTGYQYPASLCECGEGEMYLESNYAQRPGSALHILSDNRELGAGPWICPAVIHGRSLLPGVGSFWSYGLRIKYV
jgi:hypothetical protein